MHAKQMDTKGTLSTLWLLVMLNIIFADILSLMLALVYMDTIDIIGKDIAITMAIAAIITNIPILMIYLSRKLPFKINRTLNILAAIFTCIYIIGGGSSAPHYIILASMEIVMLFAIIRIALSWKPK